VKREFYRYSLKNYSKLANKCDQGTCIKIITGKEPADHGGKCRFG
jgi:hypothetical protein